MLVKLQNNMLETAAPGSSPPSRISRGKVEQAAIETGFSRVKSFRMPDCGTAWFWWRNATSRNTAARKPAGRRIAGVATATAQPRVD